MGSVDFPEKNNYGIELTNPFKGPDSYAETDTLYFYGRDVERNDLINLVDQNTLTLLYSRSGVGKSSLINAGLIPVLKKSLFYFPIYIRLSDEMINGKIETFSQAIVEIIKIESVKRKVKVSNNKDSNVLIRENPSITEFLYFSEFISDVNEKVIPVVIFDQFEEIFSRHFKKANIKDLIEDLSYIIESKIPEDSKSENIIDRNETKQEFKIFGLDLFKNLNEKQKEDILNNVRNDLLQNLKDYRFLFSFRDEYLPRFESLLNKLPSIFKMSGRLNLQTFSIPLASKVINKISKKNIEIDKKLAEHLAKIISSSDKKFESQFFNILEDVQPFLLSLICKKIYPEIVGGNSNGNIITLIEKEDSQIVDNIISDYTEEIFSKVSKKTRTFVEEELVTENERRKLFVLSEVEDKEVLKELNDLSKEQELRFLNIVQYFNSSNVEILHDRLLKPLVESRKKRREKENEEKLEEQKRKLEEENRVAEEERQQEIAEQKRKLEEEGKIAKKKVRRTVIISFVSLLILLATGILITIGVLYSIKSFVEQENNLNLTKSKTEIPKNSIGAFINMMLYKNNIENLGNIKGIDFYPNRILEILGLEPLTAVRKNLNENILQSFENTPFFIPISDTAKSSNNYSPKYKYKYIVKEEILHVKTYKFYKLNNDSVSPYSYIGKFNIKIPDDDSDSSNISSSNIQQLKKNQNQFSPDEKYFCVSLNDSVFIYNLENISGEDIGPQNISYLGKDYAFSKFSSDSKLLLFQKKDTVQNIGLYYTKTGEKKIHMLNNFLYSNTTNDFDAFLRNDNDIIYYSFKKVPGQISKRNYVFYNEESSKIIDTVKGSNPVFVNNDYFVLLLKDSLKILDLKSFIVNLYPVKIKNCNSLNIIENDKNHRGLFIISNKKGDVNIYNFKGEFVFETKFEIFDTTTNFVTTKSFISDFNDMILIQYQNQIKIYNLNESNKSICDFGYLRSNLNFAYFDKDVSVNLIDSKINIIKWYYTKKSPDNKEQLDDTYDYFSDLYRNKNFIFSTDFFGGYSSSDKNK